MTDLRIAGSEVKIGVVEGDWKRALKTAASQASYDLELLGDGYIPRFIPYPNQNMVGVICELKPWLASPPAPATDDETSGGKDE